MSGKPARVLATILLLALLGGNIAACRPAEVDPTPIPSRVGTPSGPAPTVTVPVDLPVTIALTGWFDDQTLALLDQQIAEFEGANPDILVEVVHAPRSAPERRDEIAASTSTGDATQSEASSSVN